MKIKMLQIDLHWNFLIKFYRGNLHYIRAKLNVISDLSPISWVICKMDTFFLKLNKTCLYGQSGRMSSPKYPVPGTFTSNYSQFSMLLACAVIQSLSFRFG